jgi:hypothetical protein
MLRKSTFLLVLIIVFINNAFTQTTDLSSSKIEYLPKIDGALKTKAEFDLEDNRMRFEVRNARFGAKGNINNYVGYRAEIDLSDEGRIRMLDAFVRITPIENLDVYLGQRKVPFGSDYLRSPVENIFANRSFVAKYTNDGLRDIGFVVNYRFKFHIPFNVWAAAMNGTGNNNPQWISRPNYSARLLFEPLKNIRLAGNFYQGSTLLENELTMYGGEIRYQTDKLLIESEYIHRHFTDTTSSVLDQYGFYVHSYYNFYTGAKMIQIISPVLRWDFMGRETDNIDKIAERITAGVNFGFEPKPFKAEIRLNYEKYLKKYFPSHFDKFTIEFIAKF